VLRLNEYPSCSKGKGMYAPVDAKKAYTQGATSSTTNPSVPYLGFNPRLRGEVRATTRLYHGTGSECVSVVKLA
jgi:hypothetical protein